MRSRRFPKVLLSLCVLGSLVGAAGAACISSGSNELEDLGLSVHQGGLLVMLIGFGGLLIQGRSPNRGTEKVFHWNHVENRIYIHPALTRDVLYVRNGGEESDSCQSPSWTGLFCETTTRTRLRLLQVFCVIWKGRNFDDQAIRQLESLKNLRVLDLTQSPNLNSQTIAALEQLEQLECLMLPDGTAQSSLRRLRIAIPEVLFYQGESAVVCIGRKAHERLPSETQA